MNSATPSPSTSVNFGLHDRVCIVTGASQGIGEACARRFAREGAQVVLADIDDARGQALAQELQGLFVHCDVGDKAQVDTLVAKTMLSHGRIDVLVNNAGIFKAAEFLDISESDWDAVLRVNLKGSFLVGQAVAREMVRAGRGSIVNMSSVNAVLTIPTIATELAAKAVLTSDEARARIMMRTPMKRLGEPWEVADVVAYLASDAASYVTGEIVVVDGGRMTLNYTVPA
jgi:NAD(P)-dependent dehydrogenase (short-subunit alcohol dehydrogenase family)